jgi:hypothetical protein
MNNIDASRTKAKPKNLPVAFTMRPPSLRKICADEEL